MTLDQNDDRFWYSTPTRTRDSNDDLPADELALTEANLR